MHVVTDGQLALEAIEQESFDLVLMDIQMPVLDGFGATKALRQRERQTGSHLPVVAMTAHAMTGDREKCLAAGMDDYISKPIDPIKLSEAIGRVIAVSLSKVSTAFPSSPIEVLSSSVKPTFDLDAAMERHKGDFTFLQELATIFLDTTPQMLASLAAAVEIQNFAEINEQAHAIKGGLSNFCADPSYQAVLSLEVSSQLKDPFATNVAYLDLLREIQRLNKSLIEKLVLLQRNQV